jgi:hypothetical protein
MTVAIACACACGRVVRGQRRSRRFYSTACRVRWNRRQEAMSVATLARKVGRGGGAVSLDGAVTLTTERREVHCRACGRDLTALDGPLPFPAYSQDCAATGACGCVFGGHVMERKHWTLLVLAAAGGDPLTPVQLQKTLFLLEKERPEVSGRNYYRFTPYAYGPFDSRVYADAEILASERPRTY